MNAPATYSRPARPLTARERDLLRRHDLAESRDHFAAACHASRAHCQERARALAEYSAHGPEIAGSVRDHFPADVRDTLRTIAQSVSTHSGLAYAARPRCVRRATMYALARAVAARDGAGFYGPQP